MIIRPIEKADPPNILKLVRSSPPLEENSLYAYFLLAIHFPVSGAMAFHEGKAAGFVAGYTPPGREDTLFVWQIAVDPAFRGQSLAKGMIRSILGREENRKIKYIEASVTPSNAKSRSFFDSLARSYNCACTEDNFISEAEFAGTSHETERLIRIGPISA